MAQAARALRRWPWRLVVIVAAIVALVAAVATRGSADQEGDYRTAVVDTGDVTQTLTATGSIESASRYDRAFQVNGTVSEVSVEVGDSVAAGQTLATLDTSDLEDAVDAAQDALTEAKNTLADDLDAQSTGSSTTSSGSHGTGQSAPDKGGSASGGSGAGGSGAGGTSPAVTAATQAVKDAQDALLTQYQAATAALDTATSAQADAQATCAAFTAMDPTDAGAADAMAACQQATDDALAAQQDAAQAQSNLMSASDALNTAVSSLLSAIDGASASSAAYVTSGANTTVVTLAAYTTQNVATESFGGGSASGGGSGGVPSAADILADEANVTAATADLAVAKAQLEYATLTTPVAGTVVAVGVTAGAAVSAGDTSAAITVIADNAYLVTLDVSLSHARMLAVGQTAKLTLLSDNKVVDGTVSSVSTLNSGNSFQQAYAVTIAVPDPGFDIRIGTATRMSITVASATDVLVVPTSAVSDATGDAKVQVVGDDGRARQVSVTTGAVGSEYTEITSGLEKGQEVILADLSITLNSGGDNSSSTGGLLSGLGDDSSTTDRRQFPGGGNFQPPEGFQPPAGFGGGQG